MTRPEVAEFTFGTDWIHGRIAYAKGDTATLPTSVCQMLALAGAGQIKEPPRRRWPTRNTEPETGDPQ